MAEQIKIILPEAVKKIINVLQSAGYEAWAVGGCVRDSILHREPDDWDITTSARPEQVKVLFHRTVDTGIQHGTVTVLMDRVGYEVTTYRIDGEYEDSRHPKEVTFTASLQEDLRRRDFTINAMAYNEEAGLVDIFGGIEDISKKVIRCVGDAKERFTEDALRMMRAVRFATQLGFFIDPDTFDAIIRNRERISIISKERIVDELNKIVLSPKPSIGFDLLDKCGLLPLIFPELCALKGVETKEGIGHKDNFAHTLMVLDRLSKTSDNLWLRWSALFHDIAKPATKRFDPRLGWTFHNHNFIGERMIPGIFRKMKLPMNEKMKYVQKMVSLHMRPIALSDDEVTDSAIRRLLFDAGDDIDDLMKLCEADITSKNPEKVRRFLNNFRKVREKLADIEEKDRVRNFQPPVSGEEIMETFGLAPSKPVGVLKEAIKNAILDGVIPNEYEAARQFLIQRAEKMGLKPIL